MPRPDVYDQIVQVGFKRLNQGIRRVQVEGCRARIYYVPDCGKDAHLDFQVLETYVFILSDNEGNFVECTPCVEKVFDYDAEFCFQNLFDLSAEHFQSKTHKDSRLTFLIRINDENPKLIGFAPTEIIIRNRVDDAGDLVAKLVINKNSPRGATIHKISQSE